MATANILLPLLTCVAGRTGRHPWLVLVPATCGCSLAFLLPIGIRLLLSQHTGGFFLLLLSLRNARTSRPPLLLYYLCDGCPGTPPNAIAYATGRLVTRDMAATGAALSAAVAGLLALACATVMPAVAEDGSGAPAWAEAACSND